MNIVFLPATAPGDDTYGTVPQQIAVCPTTAVYEVSYPTIVWYNAVVCREAVGQIRSLKAAPITLIGFSKSGLGAWNLARIMPETISRTIIFDAPMARRTLPPWGTEPFYDDDDAWCKDLPLSTIEQFRDTMPATHQLILISGEIFHEEMTVFSQALREAHVKHTFLPRPHLKHHWNSGWIEEGLALSFPDESVR